MERYDFEVKRGETFAKVLTVKKGGETVDLTGYEARSQVRENPDGGKLLCEVGTSIEAEAGRISLTIAPENTYRMESGVYAWDILVTSNTGRKTFYLGGAFRVLPSVTEG